MKDLSTFRTGAEFQLFGFFSPLYVDFDPKSLGLPVQGQLHALTVRSVHNPKHAACEIALKHKGIGRMVLTVALSICQLGWHGKSNVGGRQCGQMGKEFCPEASWASTSSSYSAASSLRHCCSGNRLDRVGFDWALSTQDAQHAFYQPS